MNIENIVFNYTDVKKCEKIVIHTLYYILRLRILSKLVKNIAIIDK